MLVLSHLEIIKQKLKAFTQFVIESFKVAGRHLSLDSLIPHTPYAMLSQRPQAS